MKKQKLNLNALVVKSFVTNLDAQKEQTVKGGREGSGYQICDDLNITFEDCTNGNTCVVGGGGDGDTNITAGGILCGAPTGLASCAAGGLGCPKTGPF